MKRKVFVSVLLLALLLAAFGGQAFAADPPQNPPYYVRLYGGNSDVGVLNGDYDTSVGYGDPVYTAFDDSWVSIKDDRYYVKGIREAGKDNEKGTGVYANGYPQVMHDMDFVVAYGMKGTAVQYTVNFVDADGNALAGSRTFYGNIGDKPVVSYLYIDGYQPQAYALTKTLSSNAGDNVFTFTYTEFTPITTTTVVGGGAAVVPAGNAGAGNAGNAEGNAGVQPVQPQPETIIDLDTPTAGPDGTGTETGEPTAEPTTEPTAEPTPEPEGKEKKQPGWIVALLALAAAGLISIPFVVKQLRKSGRNAEADQLEKAYEEELKKKEEQKK